jgi:hypothetical protein
LLLIVCCGSGFLNGQSAAGIIDPNRSIDWSGAGIPGGIPNRTTICATLNPGATAAQINSAIASCPSGQVVYLNAGTYILSAAINFGGKSNVTVRGDGPDKTVVRFTGSSGCTQGQLANVCLQGSFNWTGGPQNSTSWTAGYAKGATQITLGSVANLAVGKLIILDQNNDVADTGQVFVCDSTGGSGGVECSSEGGSPGRSTNGVNRNEQQLVEVTGINGNVVTISPGLYMPNWRNSQNPGAWWATNVITSSGIEDMTLDHTASTNNVSGTFFANANKCWMKNIRSIFGHRNHVWLQTSARCVIKDNYFYGTYNGANLSYGVEPWMTSDLLIENNIFQHITSPVLLGNGQGNVIAYNFMTDLYSTNAAWLYPSMMSHDAGTVMNLIEGNQGPTAMEDAIHGTHNFQTYFRNYLSGRDASQTSQTAPAMFAAYSRYVNFIGNILGTSGYHNAYQSTTSSSANCNTSIYNLGWSTTNCANGSNAYNSLPIPGDLLVAKTLLRWGNYDVVNAAAQWNASEVPSGLSQFSNPVPSSQALPASFYLSAKPSWWGTMPWPAVGPDVTSGIGPGGHVYANPAKVCYQNTSKDANGVLNFSAANCYSDASVLSPKPPTNLSAIVN